MLLKVIFETGLLPDDGIKTRLCEVAEAAGTDFVKTSTGFGFVKDATGGTRLHRGYRARHRPLMRRV